MMQCVTTRGDEAAGLPHDRDEALERLHGESFDALVRLAGLLLRDLHAAEEVVQDAFADVYSSWHRIVDLERAPAYLRTTVLNRARNQLRRRAITARLLPWVAPATLGPEDRVLRDDRRRAVLDAVSALSIRQREVVVLRFYLDLPEREMAELLGISAGAVKTHLHRALKALAERIGGEDDD